MNKQKKIIRDFISRYPTFYSPIAKLKTKMNAGQVAVNRRTDIVIEGFPRSANTYAFAAFSYAQGGDVNVARHFHAPAQLIYGLKFRIPSVMLIRNPNDAIVSYILREKSISALQAFRSYISFYKPMLPYASQLVIGEFNIVISDFDRIIDAINKKWQKKFKLLEMDRNKEVKIVEIVKDMDQKDRKRRRILRIDPNLSVAYPTDARDSLKKDKLKKILEDRKIQKLSEDAFFLYSYFSSLAPNQSDNTKF
jgi:hypothetical protein